MLKPPFLSMAAEHQNLIGHLFGATGLGQGLLVASHDVAEASGFLGAVWWLKTLGKNRENAQKIGEMDEI